MGYRLFKLGELCDISSSKRIFAKEYVSSGVPFYRGKEIIQLHEGNDVNNELFISEERFQEIAKKFGYPKPGDILLTSVGTLGIPYYVESKTPFYFKDGNLTWFRNFNNVRGRYIYYWFFSNIAKKQIDSKCIGSTQKALTIATLKDFDIALPSLEEQKKVISILDSLQLKISINKKINDYLLDLATALFEHALEESRTEVLLGDIVELEDAKRIPLNSRDRARRKGSYPYYGATAIMDYVNDYLFDEIRILLGEDGTVISDDGKPILQYVWGKYWVNNHAHILKASSSYSLETIYVALSRTAINHIVTGAVQMKISQRNLKSLRLTMPEPDTISDLSTLFEMYRQNVDENKELERLRNSLLPKLMSGEIGVSKIDLSS